MALYDVVFPLKLGPLTYSGPSGLAPGTVVEAEVGHTLKKGILLRQAERPPGGAIKAISSVGGAPLLGNALLNLMTWMSGYYLAKEGMILKEFSGGQWPISLGAEPPPDPRPYELVPASIKTESGGDHWPLTPVLEQIKKRAYKGFLLHAPSTGYAESLLQALLGEGVRGAIVLCPEIAQAESVFEAVSETAGERACLFHSGMTKKLRREALKRMISNRADIVVGVRSAVFAPLREVSLIAVLDEESPSYKKEDGLRYHTRDVAVMRGYFEGAAVLLSSICPSVESYYNALREKYTLLTGAVPPAKGLPKGLKVRVVDMRSAKKASPCLSKELLDKASKTGSAAFVINRKGYSLLECADCGHVPLCENCGIPLVFHKGGSATNIAGARSHNIAGARSPLLRCHYCGFFTGAEDRCRKCGGHKLKPVGAGIERVKEEIRAHLKREPTEIVGGGPRPPAILGAEPPTVVGTKVIARRPELKGKFPLIGVINGDSYLQIPDFRAQERAFQEFLHLSEKLSAGGELLIQSRTPSNPLFKYIRGFDFEGFYNNELNQRKALGYPPFVKTALVTLRAGVSGPLNLRGAEALGPVETLGARGKKHLKLLIKAPSRDLLLKAIKALGDNASDVDIDPA